MNLEKLKNPIVFTFAIWIVAAIFYTPKIGSYSLVDPWETHYAEVARNMLQREDYISTFWQDNGFYSKPVFLFWMQAAGMKIVGLNNPDADDEMVSSYKPEIALRLPVILLASFAISMVFFLIQRFYGFKTGLFASFILMTLPHFALVARQTITDMPFLAFMIISMVFFILSVVTDEQKCNPILSFKKHRLYFEGGFPLITILILSLMFVPQYILFSRGILATIYFGGKPYGVSGWLVFMPYVLLLLDVFVAIIFGRTTKNNLYSLLAFAFTALAILSKGFGALFIPAVVFLFYFIVTSDWKKLRRLDLIRGLFVVIAISFPWHHAMIVRHGSAFFQEYIVHHHFKRAALGVHGERGIFIYYLKQMAVGLLPYLVLLPGVIVENFRIFSIFNLKDLSKKNKVRLIIILWLIVDFFLFSFMETKFHHYILPITVPFAILSGLYLFDFINNKKTSVIPLIVGLGIFMLAARDVALDPAQIINLFIYKYNRLFPYEIGFTGLWILFAVIIISLVPLFFKRIAEPFIISSLIFTGYLIYIYMSLVGPHWGQKNLHRIYFECRKSPAERLIAWQLNWRGENFYSKNKILPFMDSSSKKFIQYLKTYRIKEKDQRPEARFLITQIPRYKKLKDLLDREIYLKHSDIYKNKTSKDLVEILGPHCKKMQEKWIKHYKQRKIKILKESYPNNKFILVRFYL